ncbi:uncharacterized protein LOC126831007 [Patella vulgata]|uniref:uncharacterized protein LOC126831007 n=1 Tax=Patella vulgata TaxID=6465 RepID=UPI00217F267C|nr:uncharacterized protein LOC126831007 [Patella vulgata]
MSKMAWWSGGHIIILLLAIFIPVVILSEEKYDGNLLEHSEDIIKSQDAEESLYKKDISQLTDIKCMVPVIPVNGFIDGTDYSLGSTVHVRCNPGYYLVGPSIMTCQAVPNPFHKMGIWDPAGHRFCRERQNEKMFDVRDLPAYNYAAEPATADDIPKYGVMGLKYYQKRDTVPDKSSEHLPEQCSLPVREGMCGGFFNRYYFNMESKECEPFVYRGCGGNGNNYENLAECLKTCYLPSLLPIVPPP